MRLVMAQVEKRKEEVSNHRQAHRGATVNLNLFRKVPEIIAAVSLIGILGACSGPDHDTPNPTYDVQFSWQRIDSPPSFEQIMFGCYGRDGIWIVQGESGAPTVNIDDPMCPAKGAPFKYVPVSQLPTSH